MFRAIQTSKTTSRSHLPTYCQYKTNSKRVIIADSQQAGIPGKGTKFKDVDDDLNSTRFASGFANCRISIINWGVLERMLV